MTGQTTYAYDWVGREIIDNDGKKVGTVEELYCEDGTANPEWAAVRIGMLGSKLKFVPITHVEPHGTQLQVPYDKDQIKDAPNVKPGADLSSREEERLCAHYGMHYRGASGRRPVGRAANGPSTGDAPTRSEEESRFGTAREQAGPARLRRYVVTEQVQKGVPVRREKAHVAREDRIDAEDDVGR